MRNDNKGLYRPIYTSIWDDPEFRGFSNETKVVFFNLRTTRYGNWPCIFVCYPEMIMAQTRMSEKQVLASLQELEQADWILYSYPIVWVKKALRNDPNFYPDNPKHVSGIENILKSLPKSPLKKAFVAFYELDITIEENDTPMHTGIDTKDTKKDTKTKTEDKNVVAYVEKWNEICTSLQKCIKITPKRRKHIQARLKEYTIDEWADIMKRIEESPFCRGENDRGWQATIDWLVSSPDTAVKVMERKYDRRTNGETPPPKPGSPGYEKWAQEMEKKEGFMS